MTSLVAIGVVWVWLFDPQYGLINQLLRGIGLDGPLWLADPDMALIAPARLGWRAMRAFRPGLAKQPMTRAGPGFRAVV